VIDRRAFLRRLGFGTVAAAAAYITAFDVEKLLWLPGDETILLPPVDLLPLDVIPNLLATEWLRIVERQLPFAQHVNREYEKRFIGETVAIRLPQRFRVA